MPHTPTLGVRPWAAGLPARLQLGLRRLLAALPHCAALRGGGLEGGHGQQLLDQLLAALQPPAGAAAGATAASAAAGRGCGAGSSHAAPTAEDRGWGAGTRLGREAASWVAAAMVASRRQYQAAAGGNAVSCPGMAKDSDAFTSSADVNREAVAGTEEPDVALEPAGTGCVVGDEPGAADLRDGAASSAGGEAACSRLVLDGWWWWCPPQEDDMHACGAGNKGSDGGTGVDANDRQTTPADGEEAADAEAGRTAVPMQTDEHTGRRRRAEDGAAAEAVMEEAEGRAPGAAGGTAASTVSAPEPAGSPAAKRRRREQGPAAAGGAPAEMQPAPVLQAGDAVSELTSLLRNLQAATDPDAPSGGSPDTWQSLLAQAESCAARAAGAAAPAAVVSTALAAAAAGNTASLSLPLPPESVLVCARRLLTPALGGGAARLLLAAVVLPAVEAVERVMPKPLLEALCAAAGPHPRPLTEAVLVPAAQRRGLSAGQSQLLLKASTAGSAALPRQLQAQVLVGVCAPHVAAEWCEPQVALAQGLVEAAKQGLEQDTASAVAGGICAAARSNHLAKSVALCRLLLSLLSKAGGGVLGRAELKQLQEAAAATNTFMTKPCLAKLQELTR
ncbi:hypothetical protein HYH02_001559 [Chlamydomonas schloesseri]|uniref:Fanconi Anaemia group E protein C-terminal domain-containing protein n=1 Tax=Chlamydomonas schloesseri TaxID=2026947 RepID=A0A836BBX6_9CHLO|nr:hypothetical protein HYH02_001559 [Chlamydomonas schloesseri]|eukprot:KAG2453335.1 hypothetical protein HYH02_001559 [Chlamydomonas schloesseri]